MSLHTVTGDVAILYPFGLQETLEIRNLGPTTILIDRASGINSISRPLAPLETITWDHFAPLYARTIQTNSQPSTVSIIRNAGNYDYRADVYRRIFQDTKPVPYPTVNFRGSTGGNGFDLTLTIPVGSIVGDLAILSFNCQGDLASMSWSMTLLSTYQTTHAAIYYKTLTAEDIASGQVVITFTSNAFGRSSASLDVFYMSDGSTVSVIGSTFQEGTAATPAYPQLTIPYAQDAFMVAFLANGVISGGIGNFTTYTGSQYQQGGAKYSTRTGYWFNGGASASSPAGAGDFTGNINVETLAVLRLGYASTFLYQSPIIESASWTTLVFNLNFPGYTLPVQLETVLFNFTWYNDQGNPIGTSRLEAYPTTELRITLPVQGYSFSFTITNQSAVSNLSIATITIDGSTRELGYTNDGIPGGLAVCAGNTVTSSDAYVFVPNYNFAQPIYIASMSRLVSISVAVDAAVTVAGRVTIKAVGASGGALQILDSQDIPVVGTSQRFQITTKAPISQPLVIQGVAPTTAGTVNIIVVYEDYSP